MDSQSHPESPDGPQHLTLLSRLRELFPESSGSALREWIRDGRVLLNGQVCTDARRGVLEADQVVLGRRPVVTPLRSGARCVIPVLYRDPHLVIIDKPPGLLSVAAAYERQQCARALLQEQLRGEVLAVHRLDRETSGVLCFARTAEAQGALKEMFARHDLTRQYVAVLEGHLPQRSGTWACALWEDPQSYQVRPCDPDREGAQWAITHYQVLAEGPARSLVELTLETGRKHQIRVHAACAGAPVMGDPRYGQPGPRLALHAQRLSFQHPLLRHAVHAVAPPPDLFRRALGKRI